jgi:hypothetical protein
MPQDLVPGLLSRATELLEQQFAALPAAGPAFESAADPESMARILEGVARRLGDNYPYFHPLYAGQMLKPPHPVARAAYALARTSIPTTTRATVAGPVRRWRLKLSHRLPESSDGPSSWAT